MTFCSLGIWCNTFSTIQCEYDDVELNEWQPKRTTTTANINHDSELLEYVKAIRGYFFSCCTSDGFEMWDHESRGCQKSKANQSLNSNASWNKGHTYQQKCAAYFNWMNHTRRRCCGWIFFLFLLCCYSLWYFVPVAVDCRWVCHLFELGREFRILHIKWWTWDLDFQLAGKYLSFKCNVEFNVIKM